MFEREKPNPMHRQDAARDNIRNLGLIPVRIINPRSESEHYVPGDEIRAGTFKSYLPKVNEEVLTSQLQVNETPATEPSV